MADSQKGTGFRGWSMVTWLLVINVAVYLVQHLIFNNQVADLVGLTRESLFGGQIWRLLTFQFCHSDLGHLFSNMLFLFFLGRMFEQTVGTKWVLPVYLVGGVLGGLAHIVMTLVGGDAALFGASASVLAIVTALVVSFPEQPISLLFIPVQFKMKYLGWFLLGVNVLGVVFSLSSTNHISYVSHLGGMAGGWLFVNYLLPSLKKRENRSGNDSGKKTRSKIAEAAEEQIKKKRQKETIYLNKKVDTILEKISQEGMHSLTAEEKKILERSSKKLSRKLDED